MTRVLILNHTKKQCGVYQFGKRVYDLASISNKIDYVYRDVGSKSDYINCIKRLAPNYVIYNWHWDRMPWLQKNDIESNKSIRHYFIFHDGSIAPAYDKYLFFGDYDPGNKLIPSDKSVLLPRPLFEYIGDYPKNDIITIGSFGFGFLHKRFPELVKLVCSEFDIAHIRFHMTRPYFGDTPGNYLNDIIKDCQKNVTKPGIKLSISTDFLDDNSLLEFLAGNDINVFYYNSSEVNPGISSVPDYALSVKRPIAIEYNDMFRHIKTDEIALGSNSIQNILNLGTTPLNKYYENWSVEKFSEEFDRLFV